MFLECMVLISSCLVVMATLSDYTLILGTHKERLSRPAVFRGGADANGVDDV